MQKECRVFFKRRTLSIVALWHHLPGLCPSFCATRYFNVAQGRRRLEDSQKKLSLEVRSVFGLIRPLHGSNIVR